MVRFAEHLLNNIIIEMENRSVVAMGQGGVGVALWGSVNKSVDTVSRSCDGHVKLQGMKLHKAMCVHTHTHTQECTYSWRNLNDVYGL